MPSPSASTEPAKHAPAALDDEIVDASQLGTVMDTPEGTSGEAQDVTPSSRVQTRVPPQRPEILAPAGDLESLRTALAAGADAVYFGLDDGFNARARAANFSLANLPEVVASVHRAGARVYLTLNTLVFESELPIVERLLGAVAEAGVDAIIVQDPAVALLAREICPELELHASTQMTISSPEGVRFAERLGIRRIVVPRELSVDQIATLAASTPLELEVFVHGALCMAWSGQCLSSEAGGGRSANRGQCAQACRMPYTLIVDDAPVPTGEVKYLLSPRDLAGYGAVPRLVELGVHGLKIEGRLKGPAYVMTAVRGLSRWLDALEAGAGRRGERALERDVGLMARTYSRGFSTGFLQGTDHQTLVDGRFPKHRGVRLGTVAEVRGRTVRIHSADDAPIPEPGMGVVFDAGDPEDRAEPGGRVFAVDPTAGGHLLQFGRRGPELERVEPGQRVWLTSDAALQGEADRLSRAPEPLGRIGLSLSVRGSLGTPLVVEARAGHAMAAGATSLPLEPARGAGLDAAVLDAKLGALGGTPFRVTGLDTAELDPDLFVPARTLKELRRTLVSELLGQIEGGPARSVHAARPTRRSPPGAPGPVQLVPLCRTPAHLDAVIARGLPAVELDWMEFVGFGRAVARAREAGLEVTAATVRVQKPGEDGYDARIERLRPDGVLVRHWGALMHFANMDVGDRARPQLHGDFSLNVTNGRTAALLLELGLDTLTAAHDLDEVQLRALVAAMPAERLTVAIHHHIPTFHTEHCVYAQHLSDGRDFRTCGRPCEAHRIALRDHSGADHPVLVDVGCRNTVFHAAAQSAAHVVPDLLAAGVRRFRVEFVWETREQAADVLDAYAALLDGSLDPGQLVARVGVHEQFGVTAGTMRVLEHSVR